MKKALKKCVDVVLALFVSITAPPVWADLPKPPDSEMASGSKGWIDVGQGMLYKILSISSVVLGAAILLGVAGSILKAYHVAHERQDLGHFFKMLVIGLLAAAIGIGLVYAGHQIVKT